MNQQALGTVLLRVMGIYIMYASLAPSMIYLYTTIFQDEHPGEWYSMHEITALWYALSFLLGLLMVVFAPRLSRWAARGDDTVLDTDAINPPALLHIGLYLIAIYLLTITLPNFLLDGFAWFRSQALSTPHPTDTFSVEMSN